MAGSANTSSRHHVWLESLGDWAWPGQAAPVEVPLPPAWVPAVPPRVRYDVSATRAAAAPTTRRRILARRVLLAALLSALAAVCTALALKGSLTLSDILGTRQTAQLPAAESLAPAPAPPPALLTPVHISRTGSSVDEAKFNSTDLAGGASFLVYLPPGFARSVQRYPVLYLLHGRNGHATAFLEIGIQATLDRLIREGTVPPLIAVMPQDLGGLHNWQNMGRRRSASYVVEVQELVDRMFPTIATRGGRAIAGSSMGGFGAMHVALMAPERFSVVESWLGYFDNLGGELRAAAPMIAGRGLHAFLYGASADPVAVPQEDPEFAEALRAAGAEAEGFIYPGGHSLEKVKEHLAESLVFAGRSLEAAQRRESVEEARAHWRA